MKPYHIVITTIGDGDILPFIVSNLTEHDYLSKAVVWIIPDRKTPPACKIACEQARSSGLEVRYMDIEDQNTFGRKFEQFYSRLPWNSDARRNLGYLAALEAGCEWLILLDDDNYPAQDSLIGWHVQRSAIQVATKAPYFNYMTALGRADVYPRGYPYTERTPVLEIKNETQSAKIGVSLGLWSGTPDLDAMTNLTHPGLISKGLLPRDKWTLPQNSWSPINSQNTAILREFIPAAMFVIQEYPGKKVGGFNRYGDIFAGYFLQAVMSSTSYRLGFGRPVVNHKRNSHNPFWDMQQEHGAILLLEWLLPRLREWKPQSKNVIDQVKELSSWVMGLYSEDIGRLDPSYKSWLFETGITLSLWAGACEAVGI